MAFNIKNYLYLLLFCFIAVNCILLLQTIIGGLNNNAENYCNPTDPDKINVHIISHTHLDVGWVETVDGYYKTSVKEIIDAVIKSLTSETGMRSRKFTFVEMAYFSRYWNSFGSKQQEIITKLVQDGKLQFTSGGWVMNDEATPHYSMIIDQMSYGHRWINKTFGAKVLSSTGWQIDPFGHTKEFASILSQMGFNALFLGRIDYQEKEKRISNKSMEFIWKTDENLKINNYLFTGVTPTGYYPLKGVDLKGSYETNAQNIIKNIGKQFAGLRTKHIMATMGGDFFYVHAEKIFSNLDKLIKYLNSIQDNLNLIYSTPDCYVKSVYEAEVNWPDIYHGDFMPYEDIHDRWWSGYFTSRPGFKYLMNYLNSIYQISKQLIVQADIYHDGSKLIKPLEEALGIGLHHDAISGTSKQFVMDDYQEMLLSGLGSAEKLIILAYQKMEGSDLEPQFCHQLNISECLFLDNLNGHNEIILYNPLAHRVNYYLRLPLLDMNYEIYNSRDEKMESQIHPIPPHIRSLSERKSNANYEMLFETSLEPLKFTKYFLKESLSLNSGKTDIIDHDNNEEDIVISNAKVKVVIDGKTGLLKAVQHFGNGISLIDLSQSFYDYTPGYGKYSGAYIMHTKGINPDVIAVKASVSIIQGSISQEIIQEFTPYLKQIIRIYKNRDYIEFDWTVGPLPYDRDFELISRFDTGLSSNGEFYTDSNGRQTEKRIRGLRQTWNLDTTEKASSNYYPVTSWIYIKDLTSKIQMTIIPDRAQGGSSLHDGSIELMLHRRLHQDDGLGMQEALDEPGLDGKGLIVRGQHYLFLDKIEDSMPKVKKFSRGLFYKPLPIFLPFTEKSVAIRSKNINQYHGISIRNSSYSPVHLLTLEELEPSTLFIRLEYILEIGETNTNEISLNLNQYFSGIKIKSLKEMSLSGVESIEEMMDRKYKWKCGECSNQLLHSYNDKFTIKLIPNQIRSFLSNIKREKVRR